MVFGIMFHPSMEPVELMALEDVMRTIFERNGLEVEVEIDRRIFYYFKSEQDISHAVEQILSLKELGRRYVMCGIMDEKNPSFSIKNLSYEVESDDTTAREILLSHNIKEDYLEKMVERIRMEREKNRVMAVLCFKPGTPAEKFQEISFFFQDFTDKIMEGKYSFECEGVSVDETGGFAAKFYIDPEDHGNSWEITGYMVNYNEYLPEKIPGFEEYVDALYWCDMEKYSVRTFYGEEI